MHQIAGEAVRDRFKTVGLSVFASDTSNGKRKRPIFFEIQQCPPLSRMDPKGTVDWTQISPQTSKRDAVDVKRRERRPDGDSPSHSGWLGRCLGWRWGWLGRGSLLLDLWRRCDAVFG